MNDYQEWALPVIALTLSGIALIAVMCQASVMDRLESRQGALESRMGRAFHNRKHPMDEKQAKVIRVEIKEQLVCNQCGSWGPRGVGTRVFGYAIQDDDRWIFCSQDCARKFLAQRDSSHP